MSLIQSTTQSALQLVPYASDTGELVSPHTLTHETVAAGACPLCRRPFTFVTPGPKSAVGKSGYRRTYFKALPPPAPSTEQLDDPMVGSTEDVNFAEKDEAQGYYAQHFEEVCRIGRGSFGSVHVCRHVFGGEVVGIFAVKKIPVGNDATYLRKVLAEVKVLEKVSHHPNIIQYHHSWLDYAQTSDFGPKVRCLFILMEYAASGSLEQLLEKFGASLSDDGVWYLFLSVLRGLRRLHEQGVLHRDIKAENILLVSSSDDAEDSFRCCERNRAPRPVIADFGTSAALLGNLSEEEAIRIAKSRTGVTGTLDYMAPELTAEALQHPTSRCLHSTQSDLYAMGVLLHRLAFAGAIPLRVEQKRGVTVLPLLHNDKRPHEMNGLITALLQTDPKRRPASCAEILNLSAVAAKWNQVASISVSELFRSPPLMQLPSCAHLLLPQPPMRRVDASPPPAPLPLRVPAFPSAAIRWSNLSLPQSIFLSALILSTALVLRIFSDPGKCAPLSG